MHLPFLLLPLLPLLPLPLLATATRHLPPKQPASPRCRGALQAFTSRLHNPRPSPKLVPRRHPEIMATLDPATDPQVFPVAQAAPVLLPRVTGAGSPRVRTNLLQSDPWMLNPLEEFPRVPGPVRPDQIASLDDDPLDWCGYLTPSVHNGVRRNLYLDSTCYWVIFYVINMAPDSCLTLWNLNPNDGDPEAPDRYARHLTVPLIVPDQQVPIREVGWHFMPMFQAWGGMEYMLKITGNGNRRGEARVYWYIATQ